MARKKRLSFKERKEQSLLETLDDIHGTAEAISSKQSKGPNKKSKNQPKKQSNKKSNSQPKKQPSNSDDNQWPHMKKSSSSSSSSKPDKKPSSSKKSKNQSLKKPSDKKTIVYIDGENTFFQLYDQLRKTRKVKYREDLVKYDLKWLIEKALGQELGDAELRYYGVRLKEIDSTPDMLERTKRMIDHKNRWSGYLANQNFDYIAAGELKIRATDSHNGGKPNLTFEEKGVDVQMAVEMVDDAATSKVEHILLLSSDRDLQPAIQTAQKHGVTVTYITHDRRSNDSIVGVVDATQTFTSRDITEGFKRAN